MTRKKFDIEKLQRLNNPQRLLDIPPHYVQERLNLKEVDTIVELGSGTAFFSLAFHKLLGACATYACDISDQMVQWTERNIIPDNPGITAVKSSENKVPLDNSTADLLFTVALHHELEDPGLLLEEAYRILKPGGRIFIVAWKREKMNQGPPLEIRCSPKSIRDELMGCGFINVKTFTDLSKHYLLIAEKI